MSGQKHYPALFVVFECIPELPSCTEIHTRSWLIQQHKFRLGTKSNRNTQLSLVPTRKLKSHGISLVRNANIDEQFLNLVLLFLLETSFEFVENVKVFFRSQQIKQHVVLRTNAHALTHLIQLIVYTFAKNFCFSSRWLIKTGKHRNCARFSSPIVSEKHKDLI